MNTASLSEIKIFWLGRQNYEKVHELQEELVRLRTSDSICDVILLLEHDSIITLGRNAVADNILIQEASRKQLGVHIVETGRGGDVTYHGPGQLICYPILNLAPNRCDVRAYVRSLGQVMIELCKEYQVESGMIDEMIGVWVDLERPNEWAGSAWANRMAKIGAIGVRISKWITMHGFALNVSVDLNHFKWIIPCGIKSYAVTSLEQICKKDCSVINVARLCPTTFSHVFDRPTSNLIDISQNSNFEDLLKIVFQ